MRPLLPFLAVFDVSEQSCVHSDIRLQNGDEIAHGPRLVATIKIFVSFSEILSQSCPILILLKKF